MITLWATAFGLHISLHYCEINELTYDIDHRTHGEMDITTDFGSVVLGSSPGGCTTS